MSRIEKAAAVFANMVLTSAVILFAMLLIYGYKKSGLAFFYPISNYTIVTVSGLLFFSGMMFVRKSWKVNVAMFSVSCIIALYVVEVALFFIGSEKDVTPKGEKLFELREQGWDIFPSMLPVHFVDSDTIQIAEKSVLPLSGVSNRPTLFCNEGYGWVSYLSDRYGFNNDDSLYDQKPLDVVLLGDSFTHGQCVNREQTIAGSLNRLGLSTLSFGMSGNGPLLAYATLVEYAALMHPKHVIWVYFEGNDLHDLLIEKNSSVLTGYLKGHSQKLTDKKDQISEQLKQFLNQRMAELSRKEQGSVWPVIREILVLRKLRNVLLIITPGFSPEVDPIFSNTLRQARATTESWGGHFYVVYLPAYIRYSEGRESDDAFHNRGKVLDIFREENISVIDFSATLRDHPDPLSLYPFRGPGHFTEEGYKLLSEIIAKKVLSERSDG